MSARLLPAPAPHGGQTAGRKAPRGRLLHARPHESRLLTADSFASRIPLDDGQVVFPVIFRHNVYSFQALILINSCIICMSIDSKIVMQYSRTAWIFPSYVLLDLVNCNSISVIYLL